MAVLGRMRMILDIVCITECKHSDNAPLSLRYRSVKRVLTDRYRSDIFFAWRWCALNVFFGFRLPIDLKNYVEEQAKRNRTSMGHYVVTLILNDMKRKDEKENGNRETETVTNQAV